MHSSRPRRTTQRQVRTLAGEILRLFDDYTVGHFFMRGGAQKSYRTWAEYNTARMNFLSHLYLARSDENLMLGGLIGDFVRGRRALKAYPEGVQDGIRLHRRIDGFTDNAREVKSMRREFPREFRRYAGIILDLAFDHELACRWPVFSSITIESFDKDTRTMLARHQDLLPEGLVRFMAYADRRGLFANYRSEEEMLHSLAGVSAPRLSRLNPLHRTGEIWPELREACSETFVQFFPRLQGEVDAWLKRRSTMTGS